MFDYSISAASKPLNISNLSEVLLLLRRSHFSGRWQNLGLMLGLSINTIQQIQTNNRSNAERCLTESLAAWLRSVDGASTKGVNYGSLVTALEEMGEITSADTMHGKHNQYELIYLLLCIIIIQCICI